MKLRPCKLWRDNGTEMRTIIIFYLLLQLIYTNNDAEDSEYRVGQKTRSLYF